MTDKLSLLLEAERRGILPPEKSALLAEARRRGLVDGGRADFSKVQGAATTVPAEQPSFMDRAADAGQFAAREIGLGSRAMLEGAGSTLGIVTDPIAFGAGKALDSVFPQQQTMSGLITGEQPQERRFATAREGASSLADLLQLPTPETGSERVGGRVTEALTGGAGFIGLGKLLARSASPVTSRLGEFLASQQGTQAAANVGGSAAAALTAEAGGSPTQQGIAGLIGGLSPSFGLAGVRASTRGAFRGGEDGRQAMERGINDFRSTGAQPSVGQATGNSRTQGVESLLAGWPTSIGVMTRFAERQAGDIGAGLGRKADSMLPNASGTRAGQAIKDGVRGEDGFVATTREQANRLYQKLDEAIPQDSRVQVGNTREALRDLNTLIDGAPSVSRFFQSARLAGIEQGLLSDVDGAAAVLTRPGVREQVEQFRGQLTQEAERAAARNAQRRALNMTNVEPVPTKADIDARTNTLVESMVDRSLPYEALQKLRTLVGNELENYSLVSDIPRSKWKAMYGALSRDMEAAATTPEAKQALSRANAYFNARVKRLEAIDHVIKANGGPEKVFRAAMSGTQDGGTTLRAVMQSLPEEGQKAVTAAVIKRMGLATPGRQDAAGEVFSAQTFLTNWNQVSPEAKRALFHRHGPGFVRDMDKVARVVERIRDGSTVFQNPSGTANRTIAFTYAGSLAASLVTGNLLAASGLAGGGALANATARLMTNPKFVSWLARATEMPVSALPQQLVVLKGIAEEDPDAAELLAALEQSQHYRNGTGRQADNNHYRQY